MKPTRFLILILLWAIIPYLSQAQETENLTAEQLYKKGDQLYFENKYEAGIEFLEKAIVLYEQAKDLPGTIRAQNLKGECLANLGQCDKAIELIQKSVATATANLEKGHPEIANSYYYLARANGGCARKTDEGIRLMRISMALKKKLYGEESIEISNDYNFMGYFFRNKELLDSAFFYLDRALAIRNKKLPPDDIETSHTLYFMARAYDSKGELSKALDLHQQAFRIRQSKFSEPNATISNSLEAIANVYQKMGNYERALQYYQRSLEIRKKTLGENHSNVGGVYYSMGNLYNSTLNYHSAVQYYREGNRITEIALGPNNDILATYLAATGKMYGMIGEHVLALEYIKKSVERGEKNLGKDHPFLAIIYAQAGDYYAAINDFATQEVYFKKAIPIFQKAYGPGSVREGDVLFKMGGMRAKNKHFTEAQGLYQQTLNIYQQKMGRQNPKVATVLHAMGEGFREQGQFRNALLSYRNALACISTGLNDSTDVYSNPDPEKLESKSLALKIVNSKAQAIFDQAVAQNNLADLKRSLSDYRFAMQLIDLITAEYSNESAKIELEKESRKIYVRGISLAYKLYTLSQDKTFLEEAFAIAEKSKAVLLLENIRDNRAKTLAGVPDSLVSYENDIKIELAYYQNMLHQARKGNDNAKAQASEKNIFETQQKYNLLKKELENEFPAYYNFKYNVQTPTLADLQQLLVDEHTMATEYFVGDTSIFVFSVSRNTVQLRFIRKDAAFERLLSDYERSLTDVNLILNNSKEADQLYTSSAYQLFDLLLGSSFKTSEHPVQKLIIIPDDMLSQFNFGTLLTEDVQGRDPDYKSLRYLVSTCKISYAYSATFIKNRSASPRNGGRDFAGFAPSYSGDQFADIDTTLHPMTYLVVRSGSLPLPGAADEVKAITSFMEGKSWLGEYATESNFKSYARDYDILHLAMHSLLNNENPEYSELLFNAEKDESNDGFLKVSEIYNLKLNAQLVVLSACSSGYGKIQNGEGPISISRAFSYAGCPSVVMSLWKVPDNITQQIMVSFYQALKEGSSKDEALRSAQLKFLNETEDPLYHHPYFWAGFVVMGDTDPLPEPFPWVLMMASIAIGIIAITVIWMKRKRKASFFMVEKEVHPQPHI